MAVPAFVINLDRRQDRWTAISAQLDRLGIETTRVPALDGSHATIKDFSPFVNMDGWARKQDMDRGSAACIVSHRNALTRFVRETDASAALILEDDVKLASDLPDFLTAAEFMLNGTKLLKLDVNPGNPRQRSLGFSVGTIQGRELRPLRSWIPGAGAYVVTREAAETIVRGCRGVTEPIDHILFDLRLSGLARRLRPVLVQPGLALHQMGLFGSDITEHRKSAVEAGRVRCFAASLRKLPRRTVVAWQIATGATKKTALHFADEV